MTSGASINREVIEEIVHWLLDGARTASRPDHIVQALCERFVESGIPLVRAAVFVRTLHPSVFGRAFIWKPGQPTKIVPVGFEIVESDSYQQNPLERVVTSGEPLRRSLTSATRAEFAILEELAREGATDYLVIPLIFTDGSVHAISFASARDLTLNHICRR